MRSSTREELSLAVLGIRPVNEADIRHMATVAWNTARKLSNDAETCEDITAAAVHKACLVIHGGRVYTVAALYSTIERAAIDYTRKMHYSHEISRVAWTTETERSEPGKGRAEHRLRLHVQEPTGSPWGTFHTQEGLASVLSAMTARDVQIVTLVAEGFLLADVAQKVGMTRTAVASRLQRIRVWANRMHGEVLA